MLCDISCDCGYMPFYHLRKIKMKQKNIKLRKIDKKKRKMFKSKYIITVVMT